MSQNVTQFLWTWPPIAVAGVTFCVLFSKHDSRVVAAAIIMADIFACVAWDRSLSWSQLNSNYDMWAALGFASIDYSAGVLMVAAGEPVVAAAFGLSVIAHCAFAAHVMLVGEAASYAEQMAEYVSRVSYGWTTFMLSILPSFMLAGGGGGGKRYRGFGSFVRTARRGGLAIRQGYGESGRRVRG